MNLIELFHQFYNDLEQTPDFPAEKAAALWRTLPPLSRDLAGMIYLLPFENDLTEERITHAKVLTLATLSAFIHGDLTKNKVFSDGEAVLYGDYLFALAFSALPDSITAASGKEILDRIYRFSEHRLLRHKEETADGIAAAREDYGAHLADIAERAAREREYDEETKENYRECAEAIGTLWGVLCEGYAVSTAEIFQKAEAAAETLPMKEALLAIIGTWKGAAIEQDPTTDQSE